MSLIDKIEDKIVYVKKCMARSISWAYVPINVINFTMLFVTFLEVREVDGRLSIIIPVIIGMVMFFTLMYMGHLDIKRKWYKKEQKIEVNNNPAFIEIINRLEKIENDYKKRD